MLITNKTRYEEFKPLEKVLKRGEKERLIQAAQEAYKPYAMLTMDEFFGVLAGDLQLLGDISDPNVYQMYWCKGFEKFAKEVTKSCEALTIQDHTLDGVNTGCVEIGGQEAVLIFLRDYFGLPSFTDAGQRTIGEYILARKDTFNKYKMQRAYQQKQMANLSKK